MHPCRLPYVLLLVGLVTSARAVAQTPSCPASLAARYAALRGTWSLVQESKPIGKVVVTTEAGGCLGHETEILGGDTTGITVGFYDRPSDQWLSTYVGADGTLLRLAGGWQTSDRLVLEGPGYDGAKKGQPIPHRATLIRIHPDTLRQIIEIVRDSGRGWEVGYDARWIRDKAASSPP